MSRAVLILMLAAAPLLAQGAASEAPPPHPFVVEGPGGEPVMSFEHYDPPSSLVVPAHPVPRARYPFVDVHNHQWSMGSDDPAEGSMDGVVADMDALDMATMVNLSGRLGEDGGAWLQRCLQRAEEHPGRFLVFTNIDLSGIDEPGWSERTATQVAADIDAGAAGLKIYKSLGLMARDAAGALVAVDDERLDPVWAVCGQKGVPVLIHSADPHQFWLPWDETNERWLELKERPRRKRDPAVDFSFEQLLAQQWRVFSRHPGTTFIAAHMSWLGHDLSRLGALLDAHPNVVTEIGAVLAELGRQPRAAREFLTRYQDRVLFGKDAWTPEEYHCYFRVLETADEYFDYYRKRHGHWKMYGLDLPDDVLRKLYYGNALELFPGLDRSLFPED